MNILQAIRGRRAVRDFTNQPVSTDVLRQLVSAASWAPSAMNDQPWHFTVVTDSGLLDDISEHAKAWMVTHMPGLRQAGHFRDLLTDPDFHLFYHAPALIIISVPGGQQWAAEDCALAAQNLMLAAVEFELGTCWIGFAQGWLTSDEGRAFVGLGPDSISVAPIIVGHPKAAAPPVPRKAVALSWIGGKTSVPEPAAAQSACDVRQ
jgi:nitroreductase